MPAVFVFGKGHSGFVANFGILLAHYFSFLNYNCQRDLIILTDILGRQKNEQRRLCMVVLDLLY